MDTAGFLQFLLPEQGFIVIGELLPSGGFRHTVIEAGQWEEAAAACREIDARGKEAYFSLHTFREAQVWVEAEQKHRTRIGANALSSKALYVDLDVGEGKGYASKRDAVAGLQAFLQATGLPAPTVVDSGGGVHAYWPFTTPLSSDDWQPLASALKALAREKGLHIDPAVTADRSRVLRPIGTHNHKKAEPRPVILKAQNGPYDPRALEQLLTRALPAGLDQAPAYVADMGSNTDKKDWPSEPLKLSQMVAKCQQVRMLAETHGNVQEPFWYAGLQLARFTTKPEAAAVFLSNGHPGFSEEATMAKLAQLAAKEVGPTTCAKFNDVNPGGCTGCPFLGQIKSPAVLGRAAKEAPPPVVEVEISADETVVIEIPNPPKPFKRREAGGIIREHEVDGVPRIVVVYPYDIFPVQRRENESTGSQTIVFRVNFPKEGWRDIEVPQSSLFSPDFFKVLGDKGIVPAYSAKEHFRDFIVSYVQELQRITDLTNIYAKLGWRQNGFVVGDRYITANDIVKVKVTEEIQRALPGLTKGGTFEDWKLGMTFFNKRGYEGRMFAAISGFGSVLLEAVGIHGGIINMIGPSGGGKTTVIHAMSSVWGNPESMILNGTPEGATPLGLNIRISMHNNIPVGYDEITKIEKNRASSLCYSITQGKGKIRASRAGQDKGNIETWRTIMVCSANRSLIDIVTSANMDATAEMARIIEFDIPVAEEDRADGALAEQRLKQNYGWACEPYMQAVVANKALVYEKCRKLSEKLAKECDSGPAGRFWVGMAACNLVGAEVAVHLGILPWSVVDLHRVKKWIVSIIKGHKAAVFDASIPPDQVLAEYLNSHISETLIVGKGHSAGNQVITHPRGELHIRHEETSNASFVTKAHFKAYCVENGLNFSSIVKSLRRQGIIGGTDVKKVLGAATQYGNTGQVPCLMVLRNHPFFTDTP